MKKMKLIIYTVLAFGLIAGNCLAVDFSNFDIHGFLSQGYLKTTDNNFFGETEDGTFDFDEVGTNFGMDITGKLHLGFQLLARDFGSNDNNVLDIDWAFADYRWQDWLGMRAGRLKAPKGLYNETRDIDMLRTTIFLPQSVYPEILRTVDLSLDGAGIYGYINLNRFGSISYQGLYGSSDIDSNEPASQALQGTTATQTPVENDGIKIDDKYILALVWETPLSGLRVGATYDSSDILAPAHFTEGGMWAAGEQTDTDFSKYSDTVISAEYTYGNLVVAAEYIQTEKEFVHIFGGISGGVEGMTSDGWYLSSSYPFTDWFALGGYYSESYNDMDDRDGAGDAAGGMGPATVAHRSYFKDLCLTTAFTLDYSWTLKLEGHRFTGTNGVSPLDQVADSNGDVFAEEDWSLFAAKVTYSF